MARKLYDIQLKDVVSGEIIQSAGGLVYVAQNGDARKQTLYNEDGTSLANPVALNRGRITFWVDADTNKVDLFGIAPGGQAFQLADVKPSGNNELKIDCGRKHHVLVIPFAQVDFTAATETDSGFDEPTNALMLPNPTIKVTAIDATETFDVGTLSTDTGDADGYLAAVALGVLGVVKGTLLNSGVTMGALLFVQDSANAGDKAPEGRVSAGKSITYTSTTGSDTGKGFINLPYILIAA